MGVRGERLRRRRARRARAALSVVVALSATAVAALAAVAGPGLPHRPSPEALDHLTPLEVALARGTHGQARGAVETSAAPTELEAAAGEAEQMEPIVGVWRVSGGRGRVVDLLHARTEDQSFVVAQYGLLLRDIVSASVVVKGKTHDVLTNAETVEELLSAMGIEPDWNDRVSSPLQAPIQPADRVRYRNVRVRAETESVSIPFQIQVTYTDQLEPGERVVVQAGVEGKSVRTYRVRTVDGEVEERRLVDLRLVRAPVTQRIRMGLADPVEVDEGTQVGEASWYWSSGMHAAHPWLPLGTRVTVTNLGNGKSVTVVINDRGPFGGRIIDLSDEAFAQIAPLGQGVCQVRLTW